MKLVTDIQEATCITHSGTMHADEVFATAFLNDYLEDIKVMRVPALEENKIANNTIVYDIGRGKYDHHQEDAKVRDNGIKYSSFGLLFKDFGKDYLQKKNIANIDDVFTSLDKELIEAIDAIDNGIFPEIIAPYKVKTISDVIKLFNPSYGSQQEENEQFIKAVELATTILLETLHSTVGKIQAKKIVLEKLKKSTSPVLELDEYLPYEETILKNPEGNHLLFVLYPSNRGGYGIKTIKNSLEDKTDRLSFPEEWAGLEGEELEKATGIKGTYFCHMNRFLLTCNSKETAYLVLDKILK